MLNGFRKTSKVFVLISVHCWWWDSLHWQTLTRRNILLFFPYSIYQTVQRFHSVQLSLFYQTSVSNLMFFVVFFVSNIKLDKQIATICCSWSHTCLLSCWSIPEMHCLSSGSDIFPLGQHFLWTLCHFVPQPFIHFDLLAGVFSQLTEATYLQKIFFVLM